MSNKVLFSTEVKDFLKTLDIVPLELKDLASTFNLEFIEVISLAYFNNLMLCLKWNRKTSHMSFFCFWSSCGNRSKKVLIFFSIGLKI